MAYACPLRPERQGNGIDLLVVRELTGETTYAYPKKTEEVLEVSAKGGSAHRVLRAVDTMALTTTEIERVAHLAFRAGLVETQETDERADFMCFLQSGHLGFSSM